MSEIPAYLTEPDHTGHLYGTLTFEAEDQSWVIEGEPAVVEMAKRLFPGSSGRGAGSARFPANKRSTADLNWLMLRFPLKVAETGQWERARRQAIAHSQRRKELLARPERLAPPAAFTGDLLPFQQEGLAFLVHNERTLLADEMGLGKTPTALAWLASVNQWPALVVVMPHLVRQWVGETRRFLRPQGAGQMNLLDSKGMVHVIKGLSPYKLPPASVYVLHYLLLRGWKKALPRLGFQAVVFDEIQELRHRGTEKYSAASLLAGAVPNVIGLSGTPIYNQGGEIWNVLNILEYHCLGDWDAFTREWCYGYGSEQVKDPALLGDYLKREGLLLRRTKSAVLDQLPPKRRVVQEIDADRGVYGSLIGPAISLAVQAGDTRDAFERGRLTREAINETRRATGMAKAGAVAAFVRALLESGEPVIVFAYHHDVWALYAEALREFSPVRITGAETAAQKDQAKAAFMEGRTNLIMVSLRAAAGLNLQRATCVVFGELDWSPAIHSQAEDRAHRMGQKDSVLCYYLVCEEGTDQEMMEALGLKVAQFSGLMGDRTETEEDKVLAQSAASQHMERVVQRLKAQGKHLKKVVEA